VVSLKVLALLDLWLLDFRAFGFWGFWFLGLLVFRAFGF
jgi:hypothetical protein